MFSLGEDFKVSTLYDGLKAWEWEVGSPWLESWTYTCDVGQLTEIQASHL